jgi:hypothetical protein
MKTVNSLFNGSSKEYRTVRFSVRGSSTVNVQAKDGSGSGNRDYGFAQEGNVGSANGTLFAAAAKLGFTKKSLAGTKAGYTQALVRTRKGGGLKWQIPQSGVNTSVPTANRRANYISLTTPKGTFAALESFLNKVG